MIARVLAVRAFMICLAVGFGAVFGLSWSAMAAVSGWDAAKIGWPALIAASMVAYSLGLKDARSLSVMEPSKGGEHG